MQESHPWPEALVAAAFDKAAERVPDVLDQLPAVARQRLAPLIASGWQSLGRSHEVDAILQGATGEQSDGIYGALGAQSLDVGDVDRAVYYLKKIEEAGPRQKLASQVIVAQFDRIAGELAAWLAEAARLPALPVAEEVGGCESLQALCKSIDSDETRQALLDTAVAAGGAADGTDRTGTEAYLRRLIGAGIVGFERIDAARELIE